MRFLFIILKICCFLAASAQPPSFNFHRLTPSDGLNEGTIRSIGQDKYGYIWVGTFSGLNRYDGYRVTTFLNSSRDTNSVLPGTANCIYSAVNGTFWIGYNDGLVQYDFARNRFRKASNRKFAADAMEEAGPDTIFLATSLGLARLKSSTGELYFYRDDSTYANSLLKLGALDICIAGSKILLTTRRGLVVFDRVANTIRLVTVKGLTSTFFSKVVCEKNGTVWFNTLRQPNLVRTNISFTEFKVYDYLFDATHAYFNAISDLFVDDRDRLWIATAQDGICLYDKRKDAFTRNVNDPLRPMSPTANHFNCIYQDKQRYIWLGTEGYGVNYFHPDQNLFHSLIPRINETSAGAWMWARTVSEDADGNLWLGTGEGVLRYDAVNKSYSAWRNLPGKAPVIHYNSVRAVLCDDDKVWIATGKGINRLHTKTGYMDFLDSTNGVPVAFYFSLLKDSRGTLWVGGRDYDGLYFLDKGAKKFTGVAQHPVLKKISRYGVHCMFEDSRNRVWFGLNGAGLAVFDPKTGGLQHWMRDSGNDSTIIGNLITSITEDKQGIIWASTTAGISSYDPVRKRFFQYNQENGLPSVKTSCLQVDHRNRLWAGTTQGLLMLDSNRKDFRVFDMNDGLCSMEFANMPSFVTRDGRFIFPTLHGFVVFKPGEYEEGQQPLGPYISSIKVYNKRFEARLNHEELENIDLNYKQNFFSIELAALNYNNPGQTWYAYKLEGLDRDWTYTRERIINYTNVPGARYVFRYKATADPRNWNVPEKTMSIHVAKVFYKTVWFWCAMTVLIIGLLYVLYRLRMEKQRQILTLETKAESLEKEKTLVQYESLKQHLNPHFLFNSLTSLRSLIKTDTKTATVFLDGMSRIYRYVLKSGDQELVRLQDEIGFVQTFIELQKIRFKEGLQVNIDVDPQYFNRYIAPVSLQNLVENAIKHNTADTESPLQIDIFIEDGYIVVRNNLQRYRVMETSNNKGLAGLQSLYRYYSDKPIIIQENEKTFTVKIPLL